LTIEDVKKASHCTRFSARIMEILLSCAASYRANNKSSCPIVIFNAFDSLKILSV